MYHVRYSKDALKTLRRMPRNTAELIQDKVAELAVDPYAANNNATKLQGREGYRLRVGDWRVLYAIDDGLKILSVEKIAPRGGAYK